MNTEGQGQLNFDIDAKSPLHINLRVYAATLVTPPPPQVACLADQPAMTRMSFELDTLLHMRLKVYAARQGKSIRDVLTEFVEGLPEN